VGFWHTGYLEFHEEPGLGPFGFNPSPPSYDCSKCVLKFDSQADLRKHLFESHPLTKPLFLIRGVELGLHPLRITRSLETDEISIDNCTSALLNGDRLELKSLVRELTSIRRDVCKIVLMNEETSSEHEIDFHIATEDDLRGVEERFQELANLRCLSHERIEFFIEATDVFGSARSYCDGICNYFYGVLAKERHPDSSLEYAEYVNKFQSAAETLGTYDRPLSRLFRSVIAFHFNDFELALQLGSNSRVSQAAARYRNWLTRPRSPENPETLPRRVEATDRWITDRETDAILAWSVQPDLSLVNEAKNIRHLLDGPISDYDHGKLHVLLSEISDLTGDSEKSIEYAKKLVHVPPWEAWADKQTSR
jgi:hypothetical protein